MDPRDARSENSADARAHVAGWRLTERPGFLVRRLHQIHVGLFVEMCGSFGVTPLQYSLLSALMERGEADQTSLANAVALDRTTTTGALKRLEARGLVSREISAADRRSQTCRLTPAGQELHGAMEQAARRAHEATTAALTAGEQATLINLMKKIVAAHDQRRGSAGLLF
jgi:DNA-binding MarR family transcriptional regulator